MAQQTPQQILAEGLESLHVGYLQGQRLFLHLRDSTLDYKIYYTGTHTRVRFGVKQKMQRTPTVYWTAGSIGDVLARIPNPRSIYRSRVGESNAPVYLLRDSELNYPEEIPFPSIANLRTGSRNLGNGVTMEDPITYDDITPGAGVYIRPDLRPNGRISALYSYNTMASLFNGRSETTSPITRIPLEFGNVLRYH